MMNVARVLVALLAPLALPAVAQTPDSALLRCAALAGTAERLACFDTLAAQARTRAAAPPSAAAVAGFGKPAPPDEVEVIESRIAGHFEGWRAGDRITLANGQVWQVIDDSRGWADLQQPVVRVRRAAMGSFRLEIEGVTRSPRVRRVQ